MNKIRLKKHIYFKNKYYILLSNKEIGFIEFIRKNKIIIISYLHIYTSYQHNHYGYQIVEYLLSHYKLKCIIGETLKHQEVSGINVSTNTTVKERISITQIIVHHHLLYPSMILQIQIYMIYWNMCMKKYKEENHDSRK